MSNVALGNRLIMIILCMALCMSCSKSNQHSKPGDGQPRVATSVSSSVIANAADIIHKLDSMQPWSKTTPSDLSARDNVIKVCNEIARMPISVSRNACVEFYEKHKHDTNAMSKLYVLNRVIAKVPASQNMNDVNELTGWINVPMNKEGEIDLLWPLGYNNSGKLVLIGNFGGYMGDTYQAINELDYLLKRYGTRYNTH